VTIERTAQALACVVRKILKRGPRTTPYAVERERFTLRAALKAYDAVRDQKTSFERILDDDDDDLPGATATQPQCLFCEKPFRRRRKDQIYCGTACRQQAYQDRQKALKTES